jgi:hypothetical protein
MPALLPFRGSSMNMQCHDHAETFGAGATIKVQPYKLLKQMIDHRRQKSSQCQEVAVLNLERLSMGTQVTC